jgi:hypothetical protein
MTCWFQVRHPLILLNLQVIVNAGNDGSHSNLCNRSLGDISKAGKHFFTNLVPPSSHFSSAAAKKGPFLYHHVTYCVSSNNTQPIKKTCLHGWHQSQENHAMKSYNNSSHVLCWYIFSRKNEGVFSFQGLRGFLCVWLIGNCNVMGVLMEITLVLTVVFICC